MPELAAVAARDQEPSPAVAGFAPASSRRSGRARPGVDLLTLQRVAGNRAVADLVQGGAAEVIQRKCRDCAGGAACNQCAHEEEVVQRSADDPARVGADTPALPSAALSAAVTGSGQPLDVVVRTFMESRFGHDFGEVRVHTGGAAGAAATRLRARAFTTGRDVFFAPGAYQPATSAGRILLAHELGHVLQQRGAAGIPATRATLGRRGDQLEREADVSAEAVVGGRRPAVAIAPAAVAPAVQRFEAPEHVLFGDASQGALSRVAGLLSAAEQELRQGRSGWRELALARDTWERNGGPPEPLRLLERATAENDEARFPAALALLEQATPLVMAWLQKHPEAGGGPTTMIAGREHPEAAALLGADTTQKLTLRRSGLQVTYGEAIALGDLYRTPEAMHQAPREELTRPDGKGVLDLIRAESAGRRDRDFNRAYQEATEWREVKQYDRLGRMIGYAGGDLNHESYGTLAQANPEHFAQENRKAWEHGHQEALKIAGAAQGERDRTARAERTNQAYTSNAFADHFLTDAFSAGHMIYKAGFMKEAGSFWLKNREELLDAFTVALLADHWWAVVGLVSQRILIPVLRLPIALAVTAIAPGFVRTRIKNQIRDIEREHPEVIANAAVKVAHDYYNANGVQVQNGKGDRWVTFGDDHLNKSATTWQLGSLAVLRSRADVTEALKGTPPADPLEAWGYTPIVPRDFDRTALEQVHVLLRRRKNNPLADLFIKNLPTIEHQQEFEKKEEERSQEAARKRQRVERYLQYIRRTFTIEDRSDSDDIARDIVATPDVYRTLTLREKSILIQEMLEGPTGTEDEQAILTILDEVQRSGQLLTLLRWVKVERLRSDIDGAEYRRLQAILARQGLQMPTRDVTERVTESISNAPPRYSAWNLTTTWDVHFHVTFDMDRHSLIVTIRLFSAAPREVKERWESAVRDTWSNRFEFVVPGETAQTPAERYPILVNLEWVANAGLADYVVTPMRPGQPCPGGTPGLGGTCDMTDWGIHDTTDVRHEAGHMLGNPEEYFTTNGVDYTGGGTRTGFRDAGGGVMNNPEEHPFARHYEVIRRHAAAALGVPANRTRVERR